MKKTEAPLITEQSFNVAIEKVWKAITDLREMRRWYFEKIDAFEPVVGSRSNFTVKSGERVFTHLWEVIEVEAPEKIVYRWKYLEYPGDSYVSFELKEKNGSTLLTHTVKVLEDFPDEIPEFGRESCIGGWKYFLNGRLKEYLEK